MADDGGGVADDEVAGGGGAGTAEPGTDPEESDGGRRVGWSLPEVAAVGVLVVQGLVVLGDVLYAIVIQTSFHAAAPFGASTTGPGVPSLTAQELSQLLANLAAWAGPGFGLFLLAPLGVAWWHGQAWADDLDLADADPVVAAAHVDRARRLVTWGLVGLALNVVAAVMELAASVLGAQEPGYLLWSHALVRGALLAATVVLFVVALWGARRMGLAAPGTADLDAVVDGRAAGQDPLAPGAASSTS